MKRTRALGSIPFDLTLRDALGARLRVLPDDCAKYAIAGTTPKSVALPRNAKEASLALATAGAEGATIVLRGAGTKANRPPAPRTIDLAIDTTALSGVREHAAADLTITVGAGTTLAQLDAALAQAGQFWPCDAPFAQSATVGGTIAANANGALRLRYGPLRELFLGARLLTADGTAVRAGAKVVKSVAGYDVHKLLAGSFGTLGLIVETTLKVAPIPETERLVAARFGAAAAACAAAQKVASSNLLPMAITLHDDAAARTIGAVLTYVSSGSWLLLVRCGGAKRAVERQVRGVIDMCEQGGAESTGVLDRASALRAWADVRESSGGAHYPSDRFAVVKIVSLPTEAAAAIGEIRQEMPEAPLTSQPAAGIVFAHLPVGAQGDETSKIAKLFERCRRAGWNATLTSAPPGAAIAYPAAMASSTPVRLLRAVKAAFDPNGLLDPGRLPGGV